MQGVRVVWGWTCVPQTVIMRYCQVRLCMSGQASCPEECAVALETATAAVADTLAWRQKRRFLSPQQLSAWDHYVRRFLHA